MDIDILIWLGEHRTGFLTAVMSAITYLGSEVLIIGIACLTYWCLNKRAGNRMLLTLFVGILTNQILKITCCVRRPWVRDARVVPVGSAVAGATGYSFPSGHTANSMCGYGSLTREKTLKRFRWLFWVLPVLIGFSRLYVGVHTIQDVLVSLVLGVATVLLMDRLSERLERTSGMDVWVAVTGIALSIGLALYARFKPYPDGETVDYSIDALKLAGGAVGVFAGWLVERHCIRFHTPDTTVKKLIRFLGGMVVLLAIMKGLKPLLNAALGLSVGSFVRYLLVGLFATMGWPLIFKKAGF